MRKLTWQIILIAIFSACWVACNKGNNGRPVIVVASDPDPTGIFPDTLRYTAYLRNESKVPLELELIQMPGGYVGSGTFFHCSVEKWDETKKQWVNLYEIKYQDFSKPIVRLLTIPPGDVLEVGQFLLPQMGGAKGDCVRIRVFPKWHDYDRSFVSSNFSIGEYLKGRLM